MKEFLEFLCKVWNLLRKAPRWVKVLVIAVVLLATAEAGQNGFLGNPVFWVFARILPWPQLFEPAHSIASVYDISTSGASFTPLGFATPCPLGAKVRIQAQRSGDGWMAIAGWNKKQGLYPIALGGFDTIRVEKGTIYPFFINMDTSGGQEYFFVAGSSKPFDAKRAFDEVAHQLSISPPDSKGGRPEVPPIPTPHLEFGSLGSCVT